MNVPVFPRVRVLAPEDPPLPIKNVALLVTDRDSITTLPEVIVRVAPERLSNTSDVLVGDTEPL